MRVYPIFVKNLLEIFDGFVTVFAQLLKESLVVQKVPIIHPEKGHDAGFDDRYVPRRVDVFLQDTGRSYGPLGGCNNHPLGEVIAPVRQGLAQGNIYTDGLQNLDCRDSPRECP